MCNRYASDIRKAVKEKEYYGFDAWSETRTKNRRARAEVSAAWRSPGGQKRGLTPYFERCASQHGAKGAVHVALIAEAGLGGDIPQRCLGEAQSQDCTLHPAPAHRLAHAFAAPVAIGLRQPGRMAPQPTCDRGDGQALGERFIQVAAHRGRRGAGPLDSIWRRRREVAALIIV